MVTKAVKTKQLRDNLSAYLREVRSGTRILVLDRDEVVAEIREPSGVYEPVLSSRDEELIREGKLVPPRGERLECPKSPVKLVEGSAVALLNADRDESRGDLR